MSLSARISDISPIEHGWDKSFVRQLIASKNKLQSLEDLKYALKYGIAKPK